MRKIYPILLTLALLVMGGKQFAFAGHTGTHGGKVVAINVTGNGSIYASGDSVGINTITDWKSQKNDSSVSEMQYCTGETTEDTTQITIPSDFHDFYFYAQPYNGYRFLGWYSDSGLQQLVSMDSVYVKSTVELNHDADQNAPNDSVYLRLYAKFAKRYYGRLKVTADPNQGFVYVADATGNYPYTLFTNEMTSNVHYADTTGVRGNIPGFFAYAYPARGYKFSYWLMVPDKNGVAYTSPYKYTTTPTFAWFNSSVATEATPEDKTIQATFAARTDNISVLIQKAQNKGTVTVRFKDCLVKNNDGTGLMMTNIDTTSTLDCKQFEPKAYKNVLTNNLEGDNIVLIATPAAGYKFAGWYEVSGETRTLKTTEATYEVGKKSSNVIFYAAFAGENDTYLANNQTFADFSDAITAAQASSDKKIVVLADATIPAGDYTIPADVSLLIPYSTKTDVKQNPDFVYSEWKNLHEYRKLTLAAGANLTINGTVCVAASQYSQTNGIPGPGSVRGDYGCIDMSQGGHITVANGGKLYVQGFIYGQDDQSQAGTITVQSGGLVSENYVINDLHGGGGTAACIRGMECSNNQELFPFNQYYIQNIEPKMTIEYGGKEEVIYAIHASPNAGNQGTCNFVGTDNSSLFKIASGSVTKWYDAIRDYQCYSLQGDITLNKINITMADMGESLGLFSERFVLPFTNNMDISIESGSEVYVPNKAKLLPGFKVHLKENATFNLMNELFVYDSNDWDYFSFATNQYNRPMEKRNAPHMPTKSDGNTSIRATNNKANLTDATFIIDGTFNVIGDGALYTTSTGSSIVSNGTGRIVYSVAAKSDNKNLYEIWGTYGKSKAGTALPAYEHNGITAATQADSTQVFVGQYNLVGTYVMYAMPVACTPAQLKNSDESFTSTTGKPANSTFIYTNGQWLLKKTQVSSITVNTEQAVIDDNGQNITNSTYEIADGILPVDNVTIEEGATINVASSGALDIDETFIIKASADNSGELKGAEKVEIQSSAHVYFDYNFDNTPAMRWNAIAFPWKVDANSGVKVGSNTLVLGKDFDIIYYDGDTRATQGPVDECWRFVEDDIDANEIVNPNILVPGRLYMILFAASQNVVRFEKVADAPINNTELNVVQYTGSDNKDANWNGIANPTLYHAYLQTGVVNGQVYNNASDSYSTINFAFANLPVGKPVFVQATQAQSVVISSEQPAPAPMRAMNAAITTRVEVELIANNVATDKVIIRTDEDAVDKYTIGSDLAKAGVSSKVAQMWIDRYDSKLCKNTVAPIDGVAEYPLTIFAPVSGDYLLNVQHMEENMALYLTLNGEAIAELTDLSYSLFLDKGNNSEYGLRLVSKTIPGVVTSLDEAIAQGNEINKVIYRGNMYIIRNKQIYNAAGQLIK